MGVKMGVQVYIIFFILPDWGIQLNAFQTALLAMAIIGSAFICEIVAGGINAISRGQRVWQIHPDPVHQLPGADPEGADRVLFMDMGKIVETGKPDEFFDNSQTLRAADFISKILAH